jgi:ubiquinone/menaquinone biosynthesis C-methylase UbiE
MDEVMLSMPDKNGIINALPNELSEENRQRLKEFGTFMFIYDFAQVYFVRPRIHKADPQRHREILKSLISPIEKSRVLDIACGTGGAIAYFDKSNEYTGLDLSYSMLKQAVKKAKKKSFKTCRFIQGNAEKLLFDDESFNFVLMDTALHMIPKYQLAITEIAKVLTKDGLFVCSTPVVGINKEFDANWKKIADNRSLHSFTVDDIQNVCSRNGLNFTHCDTNGGVLYFHGHKGK